MSVDRRRALELLNRLQQLPAPDREAALRAEADPALAAEVRRLLSLEAPDDFLEQPTLDLGRLIGGDVLLGRRFGEHVLTAELARGGMGLVFRAEHVETGQAAVVKLLPLFLRSNAVAYERFRREVETLQRLRHPATVPVLDSGDWADEAWFSMPLIDGHDLGVELERQRERRASAGAPRLLPGFCGPEYVVAVVRGVRRIAEALDEAHQLGVVHRDVKPRNILLDAQGLFHLSDFGLVQLADSKLTQTEEAVGTLQYMSPEQIRVLKLEVDARSDVYSLSVVLYELLSLSVPYEGSTHPELIKQISSGGHCWLGRANPELNPDLVLICEQGMAWDPADRYQSAGDLAADLRRFLNHERVRARRPRLRSRLRQWARAHPLRAAVSVAVPLAALIAWFVLTWVAQARQEARWSESLRAALARPSWQGHEAEALEARVALQAARRHGDLGEQTWALMSALAERLAEDRLARLERIESLRASGFGGQQVRADDDLLSATSPRDLLQSVELAGQALRLHPDDERLSELASLAGTFHPLRVTWSVDAGPRFAASARVWAVPRDRASDSFGEPLDLGPLPVQERLPPGAWRFVVLAPGAWPAEFDRELDWGLDEELLEVRLRPRESSPEGFLFQPATRLVLDARRLLGCSLVGDAVELADHWIGETEVSNREYLEFLEATGHAPPKQWQLIGYTGEWQLLPGVDADERFLDLPASGMSVYDMRDYAEWAGARLPTHHELEYALRGPQMWTELPAGTLANVDGPDAGLPAADRRGRFANYLRSTLPVREPGYAQPPFGLFHAVGNVAEFSSSALTERHRRQVHADVTRHIHMGGAWDAEVDGDRLFEHAHWGTDTAYASFDRGFRLARSEALP